MGFPRVNPSSKGEIRLLSDIDIASFNPYIIQDFLEKINWKAVVFSGKGWYNGKNYYTQNRRDQCE
jgi:hypothetical protein